MLLSCCFIFVVWCPATPNALSRTWDFIAFGRNFACFSSFAIRSFSNVFDLVRTIFLLCHHFDQFLPFHLFHAHCTMYVHTLAHPFDRNFSRFSISSKAMARCWCLVIGCRFAVGNKRASKQLCSSSSRFFFICHLQRGESSNWTIWTIIFAFLSNIPK